MLLKTMKEIIKKASLLEESESSFDSQNDTNFASQTSSESSFYDKVEAKKNQPNNTKGTVEQRLIEEVNLYEESNYKGVLLQKVLAITKTVSQPLLTAKELLVSQDTFATKSDQE